jgi:hypothetical protein
MQKKERPPVSDKMHCECGLRIAAGEPNCDMRRDQLLARDYEQSALYWSYHRMAVDAYCLQHSAYVASPKSFAAHLCGLCVAIEHRNDAGILRRLQQWLSTNPALQKPALPTFRGEVTIGDVCNLDDPVEFGKAVNGWARSVWQAYHDFQPLARQWLDRALSRTSVK